MQKSPEPRGPSPLDDSPEPPDFQAEENLRIERMQLRALPVAISGTLITLVYALTSGRFEMVLPTGAGAIGFLIALLLVRRGKFDVSTLVIVITAMFLVTESGIRGQGLRDPATLAYPVIIIWAGMTLRSRLFFFSAAVVAASASLLAVHSVSTWLASGDTGARALGEVLTSAIILGATAYAVWMLANTARTGLTTARSEIQRRHEMERELRHISMRDSLTGLFNRRFFDAEVNRLENTRDTPVSIIVADVDNLKMVNDKHGHAAGDRLLVDAAAVLAAAVRAEDVLARVGGDEFSILLPTTDHHVAEQTISRIAQKLAELAENNPLPVSLSLGSATSSDGGLLEAWRLADARMYAEKTAKKAKWLTAEAEGSAVQNGMACPALDPPTT